MKRIRQFVWPIWVGGLGLLILLTIVSVWEDVRLSFEGGDDMHPGTVGGITISKGWIMGDIVNIGGTMGFSYPEGAFGGVSTILTTPEGGFFYTARFPMWEPIGILAIWPAWRLVSTVRRSRHAKTGRFCSTCGYNLTGNVSGICPECGESIKLLIA